MCGIYFEVLRFCRITDRSSLRISRNENGGRFRFIFDRDDDEDDVVLFDEVEHLAVRSCDPQMSDDDCLWSGSPASLLDHEGDTIFPSTSSQSVVVVVDEVDADRIGGKVIFGFISALTLTNVAIWAVGMVHLGLSSVGLLLALVSVLPVPIITFEYLPCRLPLNCSIEKSKMEFCSFAIESEELELALTGISSKSLDFGRFADLSNNCFKLVAFSYRFLIRSASDVALCPLVLGRNSKFCLPAAFSRSLLTPTTLKPMD